MQHVHLGTRRSHIDGIDREIVVYDWHSGFECVVWMFDEKRDPFKLYTRQERPSDSQLPQRWWTKAEAYEAGRNMWRIIYHTHLAPEKRLDRIQYFAKRSDLVEFLYGWGSRTKHLVLTCDCTKEK